MIARAGRASPARCRAGGAGFTLIELMVVVLLVGLVATFAVISIGGDTMRERQQREARRLLARMDLAREEAVMQARSLGLRLSDRGYRFLELRRERWRPLDTAGALAPRELPEGMSLEVDVDGLEVALADQGNGSGRSSGAGGDGDDGDDDGAPKPQIFFLPGGEIVPGFTITVLSADTATEYRIAPGDEQWLELTEHRF